MFCCSKKMTPEAFAQAAEKALGGRFRSAVLYGSAAAGDCAGKGSDFNVLLVADLFDMDAMEELSRPFLKWTSAGNPAPRLFTEKQLRDSCDVFPIEMLDMLQAHKILAGADVFDGLSVSHANLRHQVEFELRAKLLSLRESCVASACDGFQLGYLMLAASSPVLSVLRAALRLYEKDVPVDKLAALDLLSKHIAFDVAPFKHLAEAKKKGGKITFDRSDKGVSLHEAEKLFTTYTQQIEIVTDAVNALQPA